MKKSQNPPKKQKLFKEEKPKKSSIPEIKPPVTKGMGSFDITLKGHYDKLGCVFPMVIISILLHAEFG